jgi:hypothetical protein
MLVWGWLLVKVRGAKPKTNPDYASLESECNRGPHCGGASVRRLENLIDRSNTLKLHSGHANSKLGCGEWDIQQNGRIITS